jgi:hypothetical protein
MRFKTGDFIGFDWLDHGGNHVLIVDEISSIVNDRYVVHFLYGLRGEAELISEEQVLILGNNESGTTEFMGWSGKYTIINDSPLLDKLKKP